MCHVVIADQQERHDLQAELSNQQEQRDLQAEFTSPSRLGPVANGRRSKGRWIIMYGRPNITNVRIAFLPRVI